MKALLFGSVGSIIETSELQREAFNEAFVKHDLDWRWEQEDYRAMLASSGGNDRIERYANEQGITVDSKAVHATKTSVFVQLLRERQPSLRDGVLSSLNRAREAHMTTGLISTTADETISALLDLDDGILRSLLDVTTSANDGFAQKPSPEAYSATFDRLQIKPIEALVVEDNEAGLEAARSAGAHVIAYLGENTLNHDTSGLRWIAEKDLFPIVSSVLQADQQRSA
ncbi:MAG: HAD-IA family hydrolase [Pseudomonadota bacterium]